MEKNKEELGHIGYKILAVLLAVVAWLAVANISDYQTTREISGIPVTQINGDVLDELDQVYDVASGDTVDIIVKGRRSIVGTLGREDFTAIADLSTMSITNSVTISVEAKSNSVKDEISITCVDNTMKLNLEDKVTQQFPVKVVTSGTTKAGYAVSSTASTPNIVKVEGPKSAVEKITEIRANVDVTSRNESFEAQAELKIYDAYGEEIKNDKLHIDVSEAKVAVEIYATKEIPVTVTLRGTPDDAYGVENVLYQPQTVEVVGPKDDLEKVETLEIDDISVSGMTADYQTDVDVRDYLPDGVSVVGIPPEITVNISITKLEEKKLNVKEENFKLDKQSPDYTYKITLDNFSITAAGFSDVIDKLKLEDIVPTIDCSNLPVGNHSNVKVTLKEIDGINYEITGTVNVDVSNADE